MGSHKKLAVIGDPVAHSLSPALHQFFIENFQLPFSYDAIQVTPDGLAEFLSDKRSSNFRGFNVTIPHKQTIIPLLDKISETARAIGAVNTVILEDDFAIGENTDVLGFQSMLRMADVNLSGREVLVIGAGGAARAVIFALQQAGVSRIFLSNRSQQRLQQCASWMASAIAATWEAWGWNELDRLAKEKSPEIIINTTSVGMHPRVDESPLPSSLLSPSMTVVDLIYNPLPTRLLREAKDAGAKVVDGLNMLIMQGVAAMEEWSGRKLGIEPKLPELQRVLLGGLV